MFDHNTTCELGELLMINCLIINQSRKNISLHRLYINIYCAILLNITLLFQDY